MFTKTLACPGLLSSSQAPVFWFFTKHRTRPHRCQSPKAALSPSLLPSEILHQLSPVAAPAHPGPARPRGAPTTTTLGPCVDTTAPNLGHRSAPVSSASSGDSPHHLHSRWQPMLADSRPHHHSPLPAHPHTAPPAPQVSTSQASQRPHFLRPLQTATVSSDQLSPRPIYTAASRKRPSPGSAGLPPGPRPGPRVSRNRPAAAPPLPLVTAAHASRSVRTSGRSKPAGTWVPGLGGSFACTAPLILLRATAAITDSARNLRGS